MELVIRALFLLFIFQASQHIADELICASIESPIKIATNQDDAMFTRRADTRPRPPRKTMYERFALLVLGDKAAESTKIRVSNRQKWLKINLHRSIWFRVSKYDLNMK